MPTYDYRCKKCGHRFEEFQKMTDPPLKQCPECKGPVERLIGGGAGFILKGSGFYQTDYRSEDYKKKAKAESGAEKKGTSPDSSDKSKAQDKKSDSKAGSGGKKEKDTKK